MNLKSQRAGSGSCAAVTLVELMFGLAIGALLLGAGVTLHVYSTYSFAAQFNYMDLDSHSGFALDHMSKNIRQTARLISYSSTQLSFTNNNGSTLRYTYDPVSGVLTEVNGAQTTVLLEQCDKLSFSIFQQNPIAGSAEFYTTTNPALCKLVQVQWHCTRSLRGQKQNAESVQTAKIVIRKHSL